VTTLCINPQCPQPENADDRDRCQSCGAKLRLGDRFRPVQLLGQGGFGRTVLAWDELPTPPQRCVIKQILKSRGDRQRDLEEANLLAQLGQHPQIPSLRAILDSPRDICLVQTYVAGRTLQQILEAEGPFPERQVRSLLLSLLPVLQFIHNHGVIHRDIKPENILRPNSDQPPVLVDFGAARTVPTATELAKTGTVIGSAGYAAPEQALGKAIPASDLYSLGVTCLHLLTGQHPFDLYSIAEDRWVWQPYCTAPVSQSLARVLDRLTARAIRSRYGTAEAALADLAPAGILATHSPPSPLVKVTDTAWHCEQIWPTSEDIINALAVSPDGRAVATGSRDRAVQLWDRHTGERIHTFAQRFGLGEGHTDAVTAVQFYRNGRTLITASQDGTAKLWDLQTYRLQQTLKPPGWQITAIALTPDGQTLITASADGHLTRWTLPAGTQALDWVRHAGAVNAIALAPDGTRLASVGETGTLRLWALPDAQLLHTWTANANLLSVALSAADPSLITGSVKGEVTVWSLTEFDQSFQLHSHQDAVSAIALSPDGQWLATGSRDREIHLWNWRAEPKPRLAILRHDWAICALTFTPDSTTLISSGADATIRLWQAS